MAGGVVSAHCNHHPADCDGPACASALKAKPLADLIETHEWESTYLGGEMTCGCGWNGPDHGLHVAGMILASDWLAERDAKIRTEAKETADIGWQSQVEKYAELVESYRESLERVQVNASKRIQRMRAELLRITGPA